MPSAEQSLSSALGGTQQQYQFGNALGISHDLIYSVPDSIPNSLDSHRQFPDLLLPAYNPSNATFLILYDLRS